MTATPTPEPDTTPPDLDAVERLAVTLAAGAGEQARLALEWAVVVEYKPDTRGKENTRDPVSEVDRAVEDLVRRRVAERFPGHAVIGEEMDEQPDASAETVWVIDPIDGTANFVNGFPLFAVSIGVLHRGRPVAGAVWCGTTHALRSGVYHARAGGPLCLDGVEVPAERATVAKRRLAAAPGGSPGGTREWDHRVTGSIAIEGALVAAGVFTSSTFWAPRIWDVAAGVVLVQASGREVWLRDGSGWRPFERFEAPDHLPRRRGEATDGPPRTPTLRDWRGSLIVGTAEATAAIRSRSRGPGLLPRLRQRFARGLR
ncbi:MAG: inositol monophosphatase [Dehalococcoidia bacterium]